MIDSVPRSTIYDPTRNVVLGPDGNPIKTQWNVPGEKIDIPLRVMDLLHESDPILKQEPLPWNFDENQGDPQEMHNLLLENMVAHNGLGLSANQLGMPVKVFSMYVTDQEGIVCFNPKITQESNEIVSMKEGCWQDKKLRKFTRLILAKTICLLQLLVS